MSEQRHTIASRNAATGLIEILDAITGDIIAVQHTYDFTPGSNDPERSILVTTPEGHTVELQKGPASEAYEQDTSLIPSRWRYSDTLAQLICEQITMGERITKLPRGYPPYSTVARWRKERPEFRQMLEDAVKDRADQFHDMLLDYLEEMKESGAEDRASVARVQIDAIKWMSKVGNVDKYGDKTKISGDSSSPLTIVLESGIRRSNIPPEIDATHFEPENEKILNSSQSQIETSLFETRAEAAKPHSSVEAIQLTLPLPETGDY